MNEILTLILTLLAGVALGLFFFVGLWWTVRKGMASKHPALWFLSSMLARTGIILAGFYYVSSGHWDRLLACLVGFIMARLVVTLRLRPSQVQPASAPIGYPSTPIQEDDHAS